MRHKIKQLTTRQTLHWSLDALLQKLNPILRGWAHFYCYCTGAKQVLGGLDWYVGERVWRWMRKKHPEASVRCCFDTGDRAGTVRRGGCGKATGMSNTKWAG